MCDADNVEAIGAAIDKLLGEGNRVAVARKLMAKAFKDDDFRYGYQANIAMCIYDRCDDSVCPSHEKRNEIASDVVHILFER